MLLCFGVYDFEVFVVVLCIGWRYWYVMIGLFGRALRLLFCVGLLPGCLVCLLLVFVLGLFLAVGFWVLIVVLAL